MHDPDGGGTVDNPDGYLDHMNDIDNYGQDKANAYQAASDRRQQWLNENCELIHGAGGCEGDLTPLQQPEHYWQTGQAQKCREHNGSGYPHRVAPQFCNPDQRIYRHWHRRLQHHHLQV